MPVEKLKDYLDSHNVKYISIEHSVAYTAKEIAERINVKGDHISIPFPQQDVHMHTVQ